MNWLYKVFPGNKTLFLEPFQCVGERAGTHTAKQIFQFAEPSRFFQKVAHNEEGTGVSKKICNTRHGAIRAQLSPLATRSQHYTTISHLNSLYKVK